MITNNYHQCLSCRVLIQIDVSYLFFFSQRLERDKCAKTMQVSIRTKILQKKKTTGEFIFTFNYLR